VQRFDDWNLPVAVEILAIPMISDMKIAAWGVDAGVFWDT